MKTIPWRSRIVIDLFKLKRRELHNGRLGRK
jgi:hypothetical protein